MNEKWYGNYRAKVVDNRDPQQFGRILAWIPDLMPELDDDDGVWARPANNPVGGRNMENSEDHYYMGSSYIPKKGSWCFLFFEGGNPQRPYYFGALELENTKVLPENQLGSEYEHKWTILKSAKGRTIHISDDPDDERVEITGKKRNITSPPTGDQDSVYEIDTNQTVILLDERVGMEKLLIRTHKGDYIHVDIDERKLQVYFQNDIVIQTDGNFYLTVGKDFVKEVGLIEQTTVSGSKKLTVTGDSVSVVGGTEDSAVTDKKISVSGDFVKDIGGIENTTVGGSKKLDIGENFTKDIGMTETTITGEDKQITTGKNFLKSVGKIDSETVGGGKHTVSSGVINVTSQGPQSYLSSAAHNVDAPLISENSGSAVPAIPIPPVPVPVDATVTASVETDIDLPVGERDT